MKETFIVLCKLWSFMYCYQLTGKYTKAVDTAKQIDEIAKNHKVLNFFAKHFNQFFV